MQATCHRFDQVNVMSRRAVTFCIILQFIYLIISSVHEIQQAKACSF
jgi:hypothetical protein